MQYCILRTLAKSRRMHGRGGEQRQLVFLIKANKQQNDHKSFEDARALLCTVFAILKQGTEIKLRETQASKLYYWVATECPPVGAGQEKWEKYNKNYWTECIIMFTSKLNNTRKLSQLPHTIPTSLFHRQAQLASSTGEPSNQAGGYDLNPRQLGLACCALCSKKVQRLRLRLCDISGQT